MEKAEERMAGGRQLVAERRLPVLRYSGTGGRRRFKKSFMKVCAIVVVEGTVIKVAGIE